MTHNSGNSNCRPENRSSLIPFASGKSHSRRREGDLAPHYILIPIRASKDRKERAIAKNAAPVISAALFCGDFSVDPVLACAAAKDNVSSSV